MHLESMKFEKITLHLPQTLPNARPELTGNLVSSPWSIQAFTQRSSFGPTVV